MQSMDHAELNLDHHNAIISSISGEGTVALGAGKLTIRNALGQIFSGKITGSGDIVKKGSGVWTIHGNNTGHIGSVTIGEGIMKLGSFGALGDASVIIDGGSLDVNGNNISNIFQSLHGSILNSHEDSIIIDSVIELTGNSDITSYAGAITLTKGIKGTGDILLRGNVIVEGDVSIDGNVRVTDSVYYTGKLVAFHERSYHGEESAIHSISSTGSLVLAGSTYRIDTGKLELDGALLTTDEKHVGLCTQVTSTHGGSLILSDRSTLRSVSPYGKTIDLMVPVEGDLGDIKKTGSGSLKFSSDCNISCASVEGGKVILTDTAAATDNDKGITLANYSDIELDISTAATFKRGTSGSGHFSKIGAEALTVIGNLAHAGNTVVGAGTLI
jgi:hypothetical protein